MKRYLICAATITGLAIAAAYHPDLVSRVLARLLDLDDQ